MKSCRFSKSWAGYLVWGGGMQWGMMSDFACVLAAVVGVWALEGWLALDCVYTHI